MMQVRRLVWLARSGFAEEQVLLRSRTSANRAPAPKVLSCKGQKLLPPNMKLGSCECAGAKALSVDEQCPASKNPP